MSKYVNSNMECAYRGVGKLGVDKNFRLEIKADRGLKGKS
jgi:hypothetical protein